MVLMQPAQATGIVKLPVPWIQLEELCLRNARVPLKDQAQAQNLIYFAEREKQQKQPAMSDAVAQLVTAFTGQQAQTSPPLQQMLPPQHMLPPAAQQQPAALPPQPTGEPPLAEGMDTDVQGTGVGQSDKMMDDGSGAHESGSKELMEDAEAT